MFKHAHFCRRPMPRTALAAGEAVGTAVIEIIICSRWEALSRQQMGNRSCQLIWLIKMKFHQQFLMQIKQIRSQSLWTHSYRRRCWILSRITGTREQQGWDVPPDRHNNNGFHPLTFTPLQHLQSHLLEQVYTTRTAPAHKKIKNKKKQ